jgi:hypothetical protein
LFEIALRAGQNLTPLSPDELEEARRRATGETPLFRLAA